MSQRLTDRPVPACGSAGADFPRDVLTMVNRHHAEVRALYRTALQSERAARTHQ
ncbi:MAG TPA: hypothetical protein H9915_03570 [Candidatus Gemmiger faecigallinarum]|nr:hypothetical protein [Candidatus Gemmiger faecigallinarum]